jgi:hypothetical protein
VDFLSCLFPAKDVPPASSRPVLCYSTGYELPGFERPPSNRAVCRVSAAETMRFALTPTILILGVQARLISSVEGSGHVFGLTSPLQPLPIPSVGPPDTHRRLKLNLRCVSGGAREGLRCGAGGIECASASYYGTGTSVSESHEGSDRFEMGYGGSRLGNAGRRTITLVMSVNIYGCELYSLCKRHSP